MGDLTSRYSSLAVRRVPPTLEPDQLHILLHLALLEKALQKFCNEELTHEQSDRAYLTLIHPRTGALLW